MQTGSVLRSGRGWRGYWREDGRRRATATYQRKGEARAALNAELDRIAQGAGYMAPITLAELADRFIRPILGGAPRTSEIRRETACTASSRVRKCPGG